MRGAAQIRGRAGVRAALEVVRANADREVDLLWRVFSDGMRATRAEGGPDRVTRIAAARDLLAAAYPVAARRRATQDQSAGVEDELSKRRERKQRYGSWR